MIVIVGVSHKTAPLEVREALAFPRDGLAEALQRLREGLGLPEAMILSTCNRVEIYGRRVGEGSAAALAAFLAHFHGRNPEDLAPHVYRVEGEAAVRHAFRVAASLDSLVIGEPQILGQVKEAYQIAEAADSLGSALNALRNRSLAAAKRARTDTGIGHNAVSVSYVAVELARKIFGELKDRRVLLVGAGKMTELAAKHLVRCGARATVLGGRTFAKAEELAAALGGRAAPFESLRQELAEADIVISGTGAPGIVIHREDVDAARGSRLRPLFVIDIAVPRDVEASVASLRGVFLYDLDDLKSVAEANIRERQKEAAAAEAIVEQEVLEFLAWQKSLDVVPLLVELRRRGDEIRKEELSRARKRLGTLTPEQEAVLEAASVSIVNKLLHPPTAALKEIAQNGRGLDQVALIRKLLGLSEQ
jgi:glutamyl-tRNA reductase